MSSTRELVFPDGNKIEVEISGASERGLASMVANNVVEPFDATMKTLRNISDSLNAALNASVSPPDTVTVTFGLKFGVEAGVAILSQGRVDANLDVTLQWTRKQD